MPLHCLRQGNNRKRGGVKAPSPAHHKCSVLQLCHYTAVLDSTACQASLTIDFPNIYWRGCHASSESLWTQESKTQVTCIGRWICYHWAHGDCPIFIKSLFRRRKSWRRCRRAGSYCSYGVCVFLGGLKYDDRQGKGGARDWGLHEQSCRATQSEVHRRYSREVPAHPRKNFARWLSTITPSSQESMWNNGTNQHQGGRQASDGLMKSPTARAA